MTDSPNSTETITQNGVTIEKAHKLTTVLYSFTSSKGKGLHETATIDSTVQVKELQGSFRVFEARYREGMALVNREVAELRNNQKQQTHMLEGILDRLGDGEERP